ncbi:MAG: aldo/keto reductase [Peptococcaceae bacterium]|nr:aldo/keto reductase [Peptococcaceae bacterium]
MTLREETNVPVLGQSGITVEPLCFGTLALSPLQGYNNQRQGVDVLRYGLEQGINFLDTAEIYQNYHIIRQALQGFNPPVVIATKCYAYTKEQMELSLERARRELNRDVIDIFLLHEQESMYTLQGHRAALDYLLDAKQRGWVRAVGISTHAVAGVRAGTALPEVDVIHPILNMRGIGIIDDTLAAMLAAVELAAQMGKGIYAMKALGGGHLTQDPVAALNFVRGVPGVSAVAVGMATRLEIDTDLAIFSDKQVPENWLDELHQAQRLLYVADWCEGCGQCVACCTKGALYLSEGQVRVEHAKCVLCGYCGAACPHFCLKIVRQGEESCG